MIAQHSPILLATLGQRPEAVAFAFEKAYRIYHVRTLVILHTDPRDVAIKPAVSALKRHLAAEYALQADDAERGISVKWEEIRQRNGLPLTDLIDEQTSEDYFVGVLKVIARYRQQTLHLLIAGGRKAMSVYATMAAAWTFQPTDRVWTAISPPELVQAKGTFKIPDQFWKQVRLVGVPLAPFRLSTDDVKRILDDPDGYLLAHPIHDWLTKLRNVLSEKENLLLKKLAQHPDASNQDLADLLDKAKGTVQAQLTSIYVHMEEIGLLNGSEDTLRKRQKLLSLLSDVSL